VEDEDENESTLLLLWEAGLAILCSTSHPPHHGIRLTQVEKAAQERGGGTFLTFRGTLSGFSS
jgi:hypothetical protein